MIRAYLRYFWLRKEYDYWARVPPGRGARVMAKVISRGPGRPKKSDVPGGARGGGGMAAEQFDWHIK